ncbi:MAG: galactose mutarotase [Flavobacteriales bacterium]|nr:galactose mutarotase [Flavobacteriales bacterium]
MSTKGEIIRHTLKTERGISCEVTNFGCRIIKLLVPDREENFDDIVLGFDTIEEYFEKPETYYGSIIGRYANRIAKGHFQLNGRNYQLPINHGNNHIHGGENGFNSKAWQVLSTNLNSIEFGYSSPCGEEGFPGNLSVKVRYELSDEEGLKLMYKASTDQATPINLTNHSYFNLLGAGNGRIDGHVFQIIADEYLVGNEEQIPNGEKVTVEGTPFDLREPKVISNLLNLESEQLRIGNGFDHNFIPNGEGLRKIARVFEPISGRLMEVISDEPGVQFFCGKAMDRDVLGKEGKIYGERSAFCLETQHFPNSVNEPSFPSTILNPGEEFSSTTIYKFSVEF